MRYIHILLYSTVFIGNQIIGHAQKQIIKRRHFDYTSFYHTNRDSIDLAVDVFLPKKKRLKQAEGKIPTVFYLTRYVRTIELRKGLKFLQNPGFGQVPKKEVDFFTRHGYAVVILDARGSGASFGNRLMDFTMDEMYDGAELLDWIVKQPWSNGRIGTTGISYLGTTAELILLTKHPALKACIPRSNIYDLYADMAFPGGVRQGPFVKVWGITTRSLDHSDFSFLGGIGKLVKSANPVMNDKKAVLLKAALSEHQKNYDVYSELLRIQFRDEQHPVIHQPINDFSIHHNQERIIQSGTPIFRIGGWYDGALSNSVIKGLWNNPNTERVLIGPWDHGPHDNASPYASTHKVKYNIFEEMLRFFDYHLKGKENGINQEDPITYFAVGSEKWMHGHTWPNSTGKSRLYLSANHTAEWDSTRTEKGRIQYKIDYTAETGPGSRWNSQTALYRLDKYTRYPDRKKQLEKNCVFQTSPLSDTLWIEGHIKVSLPVALDASDGQLFIYVDEVDSKGHIRYVTEGMYRVTHHPKERTDATYITPDDKISFNQTDFQAIEPNKIYTYQFSLLPISYMIRPGHCIIISIAGADQAHFDATEIKPQNLQLFINDSNPANIELPLR